MSQARCIIRITMNKQHAVICYSDHHLQKSLLLKKKFLSTIEIFYFKNNLLKQYRHNRPIIINNKFVSNFDSFIFYTLNTNRANIKLYELVRQQKKQIIAFQESNQLEMHDGDVNNLVLSADLIVAASNNEKIKLIKNYYYQEQQVMSFGWLFNEDLGFGKKFSTNMSNDILLILSAPDYITASSYETFTLRGKLINAVTLLHPNQKLLIKPHPLEDSTKLTNLIKPFKKKNFQIELLNKKEHFDDAVEKAKTIYASNRSQTTIDLINSGKIILYTLGPNNFLNEHGLRYDHGFQKNEIDFINLSSEKCISTFIEKYINTNNNIFKSVEGAINNCQSNSNQTLIFQQEIYQWKYVNGMVSKASLEKFFIENSCNNEINILKNPEQITYQNFATIEKNLSIRASFFLIYVRIILQNNIVINKNIEEVLKKNLTKWFSQYHSIDSLNLYYYLKIQNLERSIIEKESLALIRKTITIFKEKSLAMKIFFYIQDRISSMDKLNKRVKLFYSLNFSWKLIRKITAE